MMEDGPGRQAAAVWTLAGGTSLVQTAAIGSCDVINTGKWHLPAQSRRRHRGRQAERQGSKLGGTSTASVASPYTSTIPEDWTHYFDT